jgi:hypothetical protein
MGYRGNSTIVKNRPGSAMGRDVTDGTLIDARGVDIACLLDAPADSGLQTALDRVLVSGGGACHGFNNCIDID